MQSRSLSKVLPWVAAQPSRTLFWVQLAAVLLYPWFDGRASGQVTLSAISVGVLAVAVWMVERSPSEVWIAAALASVAIVSESVHLWNGEAGFGIAAAIAFALAYFYAAGSMAAYMLRDNVTTFDELYAAAVTFMLLVNAFAWSFVACQLLQPGAFVASTPGTRTWVELLFVSATSFSATGLSDIVPATPHARILVLLAEWGGVMYMALIVSRLAGLLRRGTAPSSAAIDERLPEA